MDVPLAKIQSMVKARTAKNRKNLTKKVKIPLHYRNKSKKAEIMS